MMTSSNGNIFRVTGPLFPTQRPVTRSFDVFFDLRLNKRLTNIREADDLRRYRGHYDVIIMFSEIMFRGCLTCHQLLPRDKSLKWNESPHLSGQEEKHSETIYASVNMVCTD